MRLYLDTRPRTLSGRLGLHGVCMTSAGWVAVLVSVFGVLGTLCATLLAQRGEARRDERMSRMEEARRGRERADALARERREAIRGDYREVLRFVTHTRLFVLVLRQRFAEMESWTESGATSPGGCCKQSKYPGDFAVLCS
jgi:hypothetical protein